ncbi:nuclease-related domain-containing DEAD/DEAH box helicase [Okeania sp. SIO2B3]|uniref:3'-5' exonuclease n=1 Tax=Okeania sp. SIO2B3 TaxID=2607784 RepID=UPI0013BF1E9E|nr:nuclease-related domain-containing DEAD/DEAH box helicase [Okeania sp. SIO2B3]NET42968.1 DEAD/DEAH box helicase family protein [Okeania sp. SIO2B3]
MAQIIPDRIPAKASAGEKRLYNILSRLPDDFSVWYEPDINGRYPDFIILSPDFGVLIIEVKGWYFNSILKASSYSFEIKWKQDGREINKTEKSPLIQGRDYLLELINQLQKRQILTHRSGNYQGKLSFPHSVGAVMSNITYKKASEYQLDQQILPIKKVIYRDKLLNWEEGKVPNEIIIQRLKKMFKFQFEFPKLTPDQITDIKGSIYPEIVIGEQKTDAGTILKTLDFQQETLAKSIGDGHRIFFGVAGSGKTLLLISRAKSLVNHNHNYKILVVCYNVSLAAYLRSILHQDSQNPQYQNIEVTNFHNWANSIIGYSENTQRENYDEFIAEATLKQLSNYSIEQKYDAILIDEAHTFVPSWFKCCVSALKDSENGDLMIVADGNQGFYQRSKFIWKNVGVKAQGRTISKNFDLDKNYRNTQQILLAASGILKPINDRVNPSSEEQEISFPLIKPTQALREGEIPQLHIASNSEQEDKSIIQTIQKLHKSGLDFNEIAIIYRYNTRLKSIISMMNQYDIPTYWVSKDRKSKAKYNLNLKGVRIITFESSLGLEFKAVLLIWLEQFDDCIGKNKSDAEILARRKIYVGMTRAQEYLHLFSNKNAKIIPELVNGNHFNIINEG